MFWLMCRSLDPSPTPRETLISKWVLITARSDPRDVIPRFRSSLLSRFMCQDEKSRHSSTSISNDY
jgi:hypothetical protein